MSRLRWSRIGPMGAVGRIMMMSIWLLPAVCRKIVV